MSLEGRYDVHELLRQFAAEKLAAAPEVEAAVRDRHSAYYCNFLSERTDNWHTGRQLETLDAVTGEADNVQRAWLWAVDQRRLSASGACDRQLGLVSQLARAAMLKAKRSSGQLSSE